MTQAIRGSRFLPLNTLDTVALVTSLPNAFAFAGSGGQDVGVSFRGCALTRRPEQGPAGAGQGVPHGLTFRRATGVFFFCVFFVMRWFHYNSIFTEQSGSFPFDCVWLHVKRHRDYPP